MRDLQKISFDEWVSPLPRDSRSENRSHLRNGRAAPVENGIREARIIGDAVRVVESRGPHSYET